MISSRYDSIPGINMESPMANTKTNTAVKAPKIKTEIKVIQIKIIREKMLYTYKETREVLLIIKPKKLN